MWEDWVAVVMWVYGDNGAYSKHRLNPIVVELGRLRLLFATLVINVRIMRSARLTCYCLLAPEPR